MEPSTIRTLTKIGMVGSLAVLILPQFHEGSSGNRHGQTQSLDLHTWAGIALVGFTVWHYNCYQPPVWVQK
ncbi:hypothetical protein [Desulfomonile tiedjei]|uniref:hypothetical protein n=1 Tax=Desulfomonile tiedjei TaxID=2358 RepID=UPI0012FAEFD3|nr:hypothetical protein [Desulfomonile tiedjei]